MVNRAFSNSIRANGRRRLAQIEAAFKQSLLDVLGAAQTTQPSVKITGGSFEIGKIPIDTEELVDSLQSSLNGSSSSMGRDSYLSVTSNLKLGDIARYEWTAEHAAPIEYGWVSSAGNFIPGRHYLGANVQNWNAYFQENLAKAGLL